ncbi:CheR family methyltransferase [Cytophaga aurantiaca]|uniref:CheR family methyltransferase n=1 Tax=Cytophaga aurantiaca TaxID=29530 RepID=UPI000362C8FB|nr:protein-glutamate O-methyltransferase CheR [Cytophaga aurantiaca]
MEQQSVSHAFSYSQEELKAFLDAIKFMYGYDFTDYAEASIKRRILNFMNMYKIPTLQDLSKILLKDEAVFETFIQELSVTVTEMFRDPTFYKSLRENVMERLATYPVIKIWIAGCATGEEVYSIAIVLKEAGLLERSIIYATDINQRSIQIAKDGLYPVDNMKAYTVNYNKSGGMHSLSEYYISKYNSVLFDKSLRDNVVFSPHNLTADKSFNEFQLIVCRNVLIYFNQQLQNKVINLFHESLCSFGFLALGNKESLLFTDRKSNFEDVDKKERIFMKIG